MGVSEAHVALLSENVAMWCCSFNADCGVFGGWPYLAYQYIMKLVSKQKVVAAIEYKFLALLIMAGWLGV